MNRGELVQSLVEETGLPKNVVRTVVNALPTVVAKGMREGESISMKGFGSFVPWQQSERLARNPKTGEEVMITPRVSVKFKAGSDLLKELNKDVGVVIYMSIDEELALSRTLSRLTCSSCGASYNNSVLELKPKIDGICDRCGHTLRVRSDDNKETFLNRFDTYVRETKPLIDYYNNLGILKTINVDADNSADDIFNEIKDILN